MRPIPHWENLLKTRNMFGPKYGLTLRKLKANLKKLGLFSSISNSFRAFRNILNSHFYQVVKMTILNPQ